VKCVVPKKIHTHPKEGHWKFPGGGGDKSQNFRSKVWRLTGISWREGKGGAKQKPSVEGEWIFPGTAQYRVQ